MKNILKFCVCCFLVLSFNVFAQEIGVGWDFNTAGDTEGWQNGQGFSEITCNDSNLYAETSESFAKLSSSEFSVNSDDFGYVKIRMKTKNITRGMVSWYTDTNKYGYTYFTVNSDSQYNVYEIPVYEKSKWLDNITSLQVSFWTNGPACVEIDFIKIMSKGLWLEATTFKPLRTVFKKDHEIPLLTRLKSTGDKDSGFVRLELLMPEGMDLVSIEGESEYTTMEVGAKDTLIWNVKAYIEGDYTVTLRICSLKDTVEKSISFYVQEKYWVYDKIWVSNWGVPLSTIGRDSLVTAYQKTGIYDFSQVLPYDEESINLFAENNMRSLVRIGYLAGYHWQYPNTGEPIDDVSDEALAKFNPVIDKFKDNPSIIGYFLCDEPNREGYGYKNLNKAVQYLRKIAPEKMSFISILATSGDFFSNVWGGEDGYVEKFIDQVQPDILSYNLYPFTDYANHPFDNSFYKNMQVYRKYALLYDIPHFNCIQIYGSAEYNLRMPTIDEIRFQIYTSLAYGVKGFHHFILYWNNWGFMEQPNCTELLPGFRKLNQEINALGPYILPLTSTSIYHILNTPYSCSEMPSDAFVQTASNNADLVVGMFQDDKHADYMILTNKDYQDSVSTTITLNKTIDDLYYYNIDAGEWASIPLTNTISGSSFNFSFLAGGGALFKIGNENTFVDENSKTLSTTFRLYQNYPNPFNPVTKINYSLSHAGHVKLTVYDLLGRQVAVLVDKNQKAGEFQLDWSAVQFPSGVYIYRLKTGSKVQTRKMVLVK